MKDGDVGKVKNLLQTNITASHQLFWSRKWTQNRYPCDKWPPLHQACVDGNLEIVKLLVPGVDVNIGNPLWKSTPLHEACRVGNKDVVEYLIRVAGCEVGELQYILYQFTRGL